MRKLLPKLYWLSILLGVVLIWFGVQTYRTMDRENALSQPIVLQLERGDSLRTIGNKLVKLKLLKNSDHFVWWVRLHGDARHLQAGDYEIVPGETLAHLMTDMVSGKVQQFPATIVEGWTFKQMMQMIDNEPHIQHTLKDLKYSAIMTAIGHSGEYPEGRFFPDTYHVHSQEKDVELLKRAYDRMKQTIDTLWQAKAAGLPYKNPYQALIMASIVEKETAVSDERALIAGVFINRLRLGMRLQTDPSVIYGIGDKYDGDIRYRDLRTDTPYNTYTRNGLPPTPIAMPGQASILAALHPEATDYLYFVAHSDGSGRHAFSSTLAEHEKMVKLLQRKHQ
jgi:UPF0755 protein